MNELLELKKIGLLDSSGKAYDVLKGVEHIVVSVDALIPASNFISHNIFIN